MYRMSDELFQQVQDVLSSMSGIPLTLFSFAPLSRLQAGSSRTVQLCEEARVTRWSLSHALFRLLQDHSCLWDQFLESLIDPITLLRENASQEDWTPSLFSGLFGLKFFVAPVADANLVHGRLQRRLRYVLCGGPLARPHDLDWARLWGNMEKLDDFIAGGLEKTIQYQLLPELLEVPTWDNAGSAEQQSLFDIESLRMTFNAVVRDLSDSDAPVGYDRATAAFELFRVISSRNRIETGLEKIAKYDSRILASAVAFRNTITGTGLFALLVPALSGEWRMQLAFIRNPADFAELLATDKCHTGSCDDMRSLRFPESIDGALHVPWDGSARGSDCACWIFGQSGKDIQRVLHRNRLLLNSFLTGWLPTFTTSGPSVEQALRHASQQAAHHVRHELADIAVRSEFLRQDTLQQLLADSSKIIGCDAATYYRPTLHKSEAEGTSRAEAFVWWPDQDVKPDDLPLLAEVRESLFDRRAPWVNESQRRAILPVISGNRTLGILEFAFGSSEHLGTALPMMVELCSRLGLRVPYRRLLELIDQVMNEMRDTQQINWEELASQIAFRLSESGCSIWIYNQRLRTYSCLGRAGVFVDLDEMSDEEARGGLLATCIERGNPVEVVLSSNNAAGPPVIVEEQLLRQGVQHGIVVPANAGDDVLLLLVIWSKSTYHSNQFSKDDKEVLAFLALAMLQMFNLHNLVIAQRTTHDTLLGGLGHELGAPLAALYDGLSLGHARRGHLLADMKSIVLYSQELIRGLYTYAAIEGMAVYDDDDWGRSEVEVSLFEDVIYPIQNVMQFWLRGKRFAFENDFDPTSFPSAFKITRAEEPYLRSIFFNLIDNAVKYTLPGETRPVRAIGGFTPRGVEIQIQNYGIGVLEGEEEVIFEKERRGSNATEASVVGSGMGLYIIQRLVRLLGGTVELTKRDSPTTLSVMLPRDRIVYRYH